MESKDLNRGMNTTKQNRLTDKENKLVVTHVKKEAVRGQTGVGN